MLAFFRNPPEHIGDKAAQGVIIKLVGELYIKYFRNVIKKHCSLKVKVILVNAAVFRFFVVIFVLNVAHNGLYKILH